MTRSEDTPQSRSMRARLGAFESWAKTEDRTARTRPGRKAAMDKFEREVDPEGGTDASRARQAR